MRYSTSMLARSFMLASVAEYRPMVRQTDSDTCPPLLKIAFESIICSVRSERLSSLAVVRFDLFETTLDSRLHPEAVPFMVFTAFGRVRADGIRWRSFSKAIRLSFGRAFSMRKLPMWMC